MARVTKLTISAEIDGRLCYIPSSQFDSLDLVLNTIAILADNGVLKATPYPSGFELQEIDIKGKTT